MWDDLLKTVLHSSFIMLPWIIIIIIILLLFSYFTINLYLLLLFLWLDYFSLPSNLFMFSISKSTIMVCYLIISQLNQRNNQLVSTPFSSLMSSKTSPKISAMLQIYKFDLIISTQSLLNSKYYFYSKYHYLT